MSGGWSSEPGHPLCVGSVVIICMVTRIMVNGMNGKHLKEKKIGKLRQGSQEWRHLDGHMGVKMSVTIFMSYVNTHQSNSP